MKICFLDTETTSLRHDRRAWEIGVIVRQDGKDIEYAWFVDECDLDLGNADPMSLKIGKFYDRHPAYTDPNRDQNHDRFGFGSLECNVLADVERLTRDAHIVGAVPNFDTEVLATRMRANGICPSWHYHLCDVETLAAGGLRMPPPWNFDTMLGAYGLTYDEADRHTALGDARMARDLYDAVMRVDPVAIGEGVA